MLFEENTIVVVLKGRFAGKKGIVVSVSEDKNRYTVIGIEKMPKPVKEDMNEKLKQKFLKMKTFIKTYNGGHILATRFKSDIKLSGIDFAKLTSAEERKKVSELVKNTFDNAIKQKKSPWLFSKLKI
ncbi:60S ribosomal L27 [Tubulinosema ratisbonensis]|uniref:60S ribosomal L27 n=1 Tax=Tubulinosema ratisbonensis TaxID=291195 RepID=A0A437AM77_9MICR|nr:60S ribosomal L27 [Tubulinosema ratisbonensis]